MTFEIPCQRCGEIVSVPGDHTLVPELPLPGHDCPGADDRLTVLTPEEWRAGIRRALDEIGLTAAQLCEEARTRSFSSAQAHSLWYAIGGTFDPAEIDAMDPTPAEPETVCAHCGGTHAGGACEAYTRPAPAPVPVAADGTLRQAIAVALARADGIAWERLDVGDRNSLSQDYFGSADAVLPVVEAHYAELMDEHREAHEIETENTARETERARVAEAAIEAVREWTRVEPVADAKFNEGYRAALADIAALLPKPLTTPPAG